VAARIVEYLQDRPPLGRQAEAALAQILGNVGSAGHGIPYCNYYQLQV
jgi:hypothetical protein